MQAQLGRSRGVFCGNPRASTNPACLLSRPAPLRRALRVAAASSDAYNYTDYEKLADVTVFSGSSGDPTEFQELIRAQRSDKLVVAFFSHAADLTSWEFARKLLKVMPTLESSGVKVLAIGLGSVSNTQEFARALRFPLEKLYADPAGAAYTALGFSPGFLPEAQVSPYLKLLPMLMGIGSPGTVQEVLRGYVGDQSAEPVFDGATPFDILGTSYQRPFELATLRLFNMVGVLSKWTDLAPPNEALLTQQGGTIAFEGTATIFRHDDAGILKYTNVDELLRTVLMAEEVPPIDVSKLTAL